MVSTPRYLPYMHMVKIHQQYLEHLPYWWCSGAGNNRIDINWPKMHTFWDATAPIPGCHYQQTLADRRWYNIWNNTTSCCSTLLCNTCNGLECVLVLTCMCVSELETRDIEVEFTEYLLDYEMSSSCCCPMYETLESLFLCDFASHMCSKLRARGFS